MTNNKISALRKALKLTQAEFAQKIGVTRAAVAAYEVNNGRPTQSTIKCIELVFNVSPLYWTEDGDEHMFAHHEPTTNAELIDRLVSAYEDSYLMRDILVTWINLTPAERAAAEGIIRKFLRAHDAQEAGFTVDGSAAVPPTSAPGESDAPPDELPG